MKFSNIKVLINTNTTDTVFFTPEEVKTPYPIKNYPPLMKMECQAGFGVQWVRENIGREPDEVISMKR